MAAMESVTASREIAATVADPQWFPIAFDTSADIIDFVQTNSADITAPSFLAKSVWRTDGLPRRRLPLSGVIAAMPEQDPVPLNFIWHTAFCASTLLARTLDHPSESVTLREPEVMGRLADAKRQRLLTSPQYRRLPEAVFGLLGRPFTPGGSIVVKPTAPATVTVPEAARITAGKMLFLHSDCRSFLISVAQGGEARRGYVRQTLRIVAADTGGANKWSMNTLFEMSDLQIAAVLWHIQMFDMRMHMEVLGERAFSLDCDAFLLSPASTISRLDALFDLGLGFNHIERTVRGSLMRRHAKSLDENFGVWQRRKQLLEIDRQLARDIEEVLAWAEKNFGDPQALVLPNPLLAVGGHLSP